MTDLLEKAVATARGLPSEMQDEIARVMLALSGEDRSIRSLTPEEHAEQDLADAEETRGEYATDAELQAIWAKHGA